jgi:predicted Zn-dependent protease
VRRWVLPPLALLLTAGLVAPHVWYYHYLQAARSEVLRGHNAAASECLRECRRVRPDSRDVLMLSARVARRSGAWEEAEFFLDQYWARYGDDDRHVFERLLFRATRGDVEGTLPLLLARIQAGGPDARAAREALVTGLLYRYRWADADRFLTEWLADEPDDPSALHLRGQLEEHRNRRSTALLSFRRVVELDPEHLEARLRMTTILLQLRQGDEALANLDYLRARLPDNAEVHIQWVRALALQGRTAEARAALDDCLRRHPDLPAALAERGRVAQEEGDDRAAEGYFARAVRLDPGDLVTRKLYALVLGRNGRAAEAAAEEDAVWKLEAEYERVSKLSQEDLRARPNDPAVPHQIGMIALKSGQPAEALRWFQAALKVDPEYAPTHQELMMYYHTMGNPILAARHRAFAQQTPGPSRP